MAKKSTHFFCSRLYGLGSFKAVEVEFDLSETTVLPLRVSGLLDGEDDVERFLTNPNNPTGVVFTATEMDAVVDVARKTGAWLVVDEVYCGAEVQGGDDTELLGTV